MVMGHLRGDRSSLKASRAHASEASEVRRCVDSYSLRNQPGASGVHAIGFDPFLDQEAIITLLGLPGEKRRLLVDEDDDGVFEICRANMCKQELFTGGTLVFTVDGITTFSSEEKGP